MLTKIILLLLLLTSVALIALILLYVLINIIIKYGEEDKFTIDDDIFKNK